MVGIFDDRRGVGGNEILAFANAHDERRTLAGCDERVRVVLVQNSDSVRPDNLLERKLNGSLELDMPVELRVFDKLHKDFCVGLRLEGIPLLLKPGFENGVVLDDPVMNDSQPLRLGVMGVGIDGIRLAVSRPTRMRDTYITARVFVSAETLQFGDLAFRLIDTQLSFLVNKRHTCAVVATVLQTMETFD